MSPRGPGIDDDLVNLGLILIAAVGLIAAVLRLAGTVAAWLTTAEQPDSGLEAGFRVLRHPADPGSALRADGLSAWTYWLVLTLLVAAVVVCALVLWRRVGAIRHRLPAIRVGWWVSPPGVTCERQRRRRRCCSAGGRCAPH
jgi:H+/Cl- antiporter ClcA